MRMSYRRRTPLRTRISVGQPEVSSCIAFTTAPCSDRGLPQLTDTAIGGEGQEHLVHAAVQS